MAKADVNFTIGADGSAFVKDLNKVGGQTHDFLTRLGGKFFGLQAIAVGVQKAFAGLSAPLHAFGELENTQAQLAVMMDSAFAAESLTSSLQKLATNGVVSMQNLLAAARPLTHIMEGAGSRSRSWRSGMTWLGAPARTMNPPSLPCRTAWGISSSSAIPSAGALLHPRSKRRENGVH